MKNFKRGKSVSEQHCQLVFYFDGPELTYAFDCPIDYQLEPEDIDNLNSRAAYEMCLTGEDEEGRKIRGPYRESHMSHTWEPAEGECECGSLVILTHTEGNECENCNRSYSLNGQLELMVGYQPLMLF